MIDNIAATPCCACKKGSANTSFDVEPRKSCHVTQTPLRDKMQVEAKMCSAFVAYQWDTIKIEF